MNSSNQQNKNDESLFKTFIAIFIASLWGFGLLIHISLSIVSIVILFSTPSGVLYSEDVSKKAKVALAKIELLPNESLVNPNYEQHNAILKEDCPECNVYISSWSPLYEAEVKLRLIGAQSESKNVLIWVILGKIVELLVVLAAIYVTVKFWKARKIGYKIWIEKILFFLSPAIIATAFIISISNLENYENFIPINDVAIKWYFFGIIGVFILTPAGFVLRNKRKSIK